MLFWSILKKYMQNDNLIERKLDRFVNNENRTVYKDYSLNNIVKILNRFNNPHKSFRAIHISGTNGKGSVAYMLNSIFINAGYKCGLFTSPHLLKINERIKINNREIEDHEFIQYVDEIIAYLSNKNTADPTYFDILTSAAYRYFYDMKVDIAVIETGLGGRLDSTNVIIPLCSIITDISLDHTSILGNSIEKITDEKCGIIKQNVPVITSNRDKKIIDIIKKRAKSLDADLFSFGIGFNTDNIIEEDDKNIYDYTFNGSKKNIKLKIELKNPAKFQIYNSSAAITASILLKDKFPKLTEDNITRGVYDVVVPGRFQILSKKPLIIFDPAHNESALNTVIKLLFNRYKNYKIYIILSLMSDKDYKGMLSFLNRFSLQIVYYELNEARSYLPSKNLSENNIIKNFTAITDSIYALQAILEDKISAESLFFFTGTFRLYSTALDFMNAIE